MMNYGLRPGITPIPESNTVTSRYTFPTIEAAPFLLGAVGTTLWQAILPGPDRFEHYIDYTWCIPVLAMILLASGYLIYHGWYFRACSSNTARTILRGPN